MIYLHSTYHVEPGKMEEYLDVVQRLQLPYGKARGLNVVGYFRTAGVPGPTTDIVALYAFKDWHAWAEMRDSKPTPELQGMMQEYEAKAQFCRPKYESKFLIPTPFSPLQ